MRTVPREQLVEHDTEGVHVRGGGDLAGHSAVGGHTGRVDEGDRVLEDRGEQAAQCGQAQCAGSA